jgi:hypothetical protein
MFEIDLKSTCDHYNEFICQTESLTSLYDTGIESFPFLPIITTIQPYVAMQPEGARAPLEMDAAGEPSMFISVPDVNGAPPGAGTVSTPQKKSGIFGASSNLVNSIVGAGIIGIPYALKQSGLVTGVMLLLLVAYLTGKGTKMLEFLVRQTCCDPLILKQPFCFRQIAPRYCRTGKFSPQT